MAADCLPLLLYHEPTSALAAVHAGWRGATAGIASAAVRALGVPAGEITAALGPAVGPCCYEVGGEVAEAAARHPGSLVATRGGKYRFDLPGFVRADLEKAGVDPGRIDVSGLCTSCTDHLFFSHRRDTDPGRACAFAGGPSMTRPPWPEGPIRRVGLTGSIATGKSLAAAGFCPAGGDGRGRRCAGPECGGARLGGPPRDRRSLRAIGAGRGWRP